MDDFPVESSEEVFLRRRGPRLNVKPLTIEGLKRVLVDADRKTKQQTSSALGSRWADLWGEWLDTLSSVDPAPLSP